MSRASETAERPACRAAASRSCSQIPAAAESSLERRKLCWQRRGTSASDQRRGSQPASGDGPAPAATHSDSVARPAPCFFCGLNERRRRRSQPASAAMQSASGDAFCQRRPSSASDDKSAARRTLPAATNPRLPRYAGSQRRRTSGSKDADSQRQRGSQPAARQRRSTSASGCSQPAAMNQRQWRRGQPTATNERPLARESGHAFSQRRRTHASGDGPHASGDAVGQRRPLKASGDVLCPYNDSLPAAMNWCQRQRSQPAAHVCNRRGAAASAASEKTFGIRIHGYRKGDVSCRTAGGRRGATHGARRPPCSRQSANCIHDLAEQPHRATSAAPQFAQSLAATCPQSVAGWRSPAVVKGAGCGRRRQARHRSRRRPAIVRPRRRSLRSLKTGVRIDAAVRAATRSVSGEEPAPATPSASGTYRRGAAASEPEAMAEMGCEKIIGRRAGDVRR